MLAWAIIGTTFSNAEYCPVCGDGRHVGNPDGLFSVAATNAARDVPAIPCGELEAAGRNGTIPTGRCAILPPLIFDICDCQLSSAGIVRNLVSPPSPAPTMSRVSTKPSFPTRSAVPTRAVTSIGTRVVTKAPRPAAMPFYQPNVGAPPSYWVLNTSAPNAGPDTQTIVIRLVCGLVAAVATLSILRLFLMEAENTATNDANGTAVAAQQLQASQQTSDGSPPGTSTQTSAAEAARKQRAKLARARRPLVLNVLFPTQHQVSMKQDFKCMVAILGIPSRNAHIVASIFCLFLKKGDPEQPPSVRRLKYDQKSKRYMFSDDALDVKSCSICLEDLGK